MLTGASNSRAFHPALHTTMHIKVGVALLAVKQGKEPSREATYHRLASMPAFQLITTSRQATTFRGNVRYLIRASNLPHFMGMTRANDG